MPQHKIVMQMIIQCKSNVGVFWHVANCLNHALLEPLFFPGLLACGRSLCRWTFEEER